MKRFLQYKKDMLLAAGVVGVAGGVLRFFHLTKAFDSQRLETRGNIWGTALLALTIATCLGLAFLAWRMRSKEQPANEPGLRLGTVSLPVLVFMVLTMLCALTGAVLSILNAYQGRLAFWDILDGVLYLLAALSLAPTLRALPSHWEKTTNTATMSLLTVFWACFHLISVYRTEARHPAVSYYFYDVIALICMIYLYFSASGVICGRASENRLFITVLATLSLGGTSIYSRVLLALQEGALFQRGSAAQNAWVGLTGLFFALTVALMFLRPARKSILPVSVPATRPAQEHGEETKTENDEE